MGEYKLSQEIIALSVARNWDEAKREWALEDVYQAEEQQTCLCGHFPIREICVIRNRVNSTEAEVGNCCVKKFLGLPSGGIFDGLKRVAEDTTKALNYEAVHHAHNKNWITDWEYKFSLDTARKRSLSAKQALVRQRINDKVLARFRRAKG